MRKRVLQDIVVKGCGRKIEVIFLLQRLNSVAYEMLIE